MFFFFISAIRIMGNNHYFGLPLIVLTTDLTCFQYFYKSLFCNFSNCCPSWFNVLPKSFRFPDIFYEFVSIQNRRVLFSAHSRYSSVIGRVSWLPPNTQCKAYPITIAVAFLARQAVMFLFIVFSFSCFSLISIIRRTYYTGPEFKMAGMC